MPFSPAVDRPLVTMGSTVPVHGSRQEPDLRDEESLADRQRSQASR